MDNKNVTITGKRWFDRRNGNTYCSAIVEVDGETLLETPIEYGYGDYYVQAALEALVAGKHIPARNGTLPTQYLRESCKSFTYRCVDVGRKSDLGVWS